MDLITERAFLTTMVNTTLFGPQRALPTALLNTTLLPMLLLSLTGQKHCPNTADNFLAEYDYIIVGAGTAGSVVASRLSEMPCVSVLLLEAGPPPPILSEIPATSRLLWFTDIDWQYKTVPQRHTGDQLVNRQVIWHGGKTLGGSSVIQSMLYSRGNRKDYDGWAASGAEGWTYKDVFPYFLKMEDNRDPEYVARGYHGVGGPQTIHRPRYDSEIKDPIFQAAMSLGYKVVDPNGARQTGFYDIQGFLRAGQKCSTAKAYLVPAENRTNLDILPNARVRKVVIENGQAVGVIFDHRGQTHLVRTRREVIMSAGTINTAQLLMLSGIGPRKELEKHKIPVVADLPVGQNLQDHCSAFSSFELSSTIQPVAHKIISPSSLTEYLENRTGPLTSLDYNSAVSFLKNGTTNPRKDSPNFQLYLHEITPELALQSGLNSKTIAQVFAPYEDKPSYICASQMLKPKSRGTVTLNSADPYDPPLIDPNYFNDPRDLDDVVAGLKVCNRIANSPQMRAVGSVPFRTLHPGCEEFAGSEDAYLRCQVRAGVITENHQVGTARMGDPDDPRTVVDPQLRVKNVKGLRVVDASVMPIIPSGSTNAPTIMVAEKASEIIKSTIECDADYRGADGDYTKPDDDDDDDVNDQEDSSNTPNVDDHEQEKDGYWIDVIPPKIVTERNKDLKDIQIKVTRWNIEIQNITSLSEDITFSNSVTYNVANRKSHGKILPAVSYQQLAGTLGNISQSDTVSSISSSLTNRFKSSSQQRQQNMQDLLPFQNGTLTSNEESEMRPTVTPPSNPSTEAMLSVLQQQSSISSMDSQLPFIPDAVTNDVTQNPTLKQHQSDMILSETPLNNSIPEAVLSSLQKQTTECELQPQSLLTKEGLQETITQKTTLNQEAYDFSLEEKPLNVLSAHKLLSTPASKIILSVLRNQTVYESLQHPLPLLTKTVQYSISKTPILNQQQSNMLPIFTLHSNQSKKVIVVRKIASAGSLQSHLPLLETKSNSTETLQESKSSATETLQETKYNSTETMKEGKSSTTETLQGTKSNSTETLQETKSNSTETLQENKSSATETLQEIKSNSTETLQESKYSTAETFQESKSRSTETLQESKSKSPISNQKQSNIPSTTVTPLSNPSPKTVLYALREPASAEKFHSQLPLSNETVQDSMLKTLNLSQQSNIIPMTSHASNPSPENVLSLVREQASGNSLQPPLSLSTEPLNGSIPTSSILSQEQSNIPPAITSLSNPSPKTFFSILQEWTSAEPLLPLSTEASQDPLLKTPILNQQRSNVSPVNSSLSSPSPEAAFSVIREQADRFQGQLLLSTQDSRNKTNTLNQRQSNILPILTPLSNPSPESVLSVLQERTSADRLQRPLPLSEETLKDIRPETPILSQQQSNIPPMNSSLSSSSPEAAFSVIREQADRIQGQLLLSTQDSRPKTPTLNQQQSNILPIVTPLSNPSPETVLSVLQARTSIDRLQRPLPLSAETLHDVIPKSPILSQQQSDISPMDSIPSNSSTETVLSVIREQTSADRVQRQLLLSTRDSRPKTPNLSQQQSNILPSSTLLSNSLPETVPSVVQEQITSGSLLPNLPLSSEELKESSPEAPTLIQQPSDVLLVDTPLSNSSLGTVLSELRQQTEQDDVLLNPILNQQNSNILANIPLNNSAPKILISVGQQQAARNSLRPQLPLSAEAEKEPQTPTLSQQQFNILPVDSSQKLLAPRNGLQQQASDGTLQQKLLPSGKELQDNIDQLSDLRQQPSILSDTSLNNSAPKILISVLQQQTTGVNLRRQLPLS